MSYKNKVKNLLILIAILAVAYLASFIFTAERLGARSASYVWLDPKLALRTVRIEIKNETDITELVKKDGEWFVKQEGQQYPARQVRVDDFTGIFTKRGNWTVRTSNANAHQKLGVDNNARRVTLYGENIVLLDLLIGASDITGREINIRKADSNEVRSGEDRISAYIQGSSSPWLNLALVPESANGKLDAQSVQRITVNTEYATQVFTRRGRGWVISGIEVANPDNSAIENYIGIVLNTEGDSFADYVSQDDPMFTNRITLEFGNANIVTIRISDGDDTGRRLARVSDNDYTYSIPSWAASRLFRDPASFERTIN